MLFIRPIFTAALFVALAAYAFDCVPMSTPDEAMQCCDSMPCPSQGHGHSEDCCKTMTAPHSPFMQPHSLDHVSFSWVFFSILPGVYVSPDIDSTAQHILASHSHAPPIPQVEGILPLRI